MSAPEMPAPPADAATPRRRASARLRVARSALLVILGTYAAWCALLYSYQDQLLFPANMAPAPLPAVMQGALELRVPIEGGGEAVAWFVPAPGVSAERPSPAVVYFHGNAEIIDQQDELVEAYHQLGVSVLLPEYRGYGRSDGRPSQEGIREDALRFYDRLVALPGAGVDPARIFIHGRSLGGGPACDLARLRPAAALILDSAFTSAASMAWGYGVPPFLVSNPFHNDDVIEDFRGPLLLFHGTHDEVIPVAHGRRLRELAPGSTYVEFDSRHNDLFLRGHGPAYWGHVREFLRAHGLLGAGELVSHR